MMGKTTRLLMICCMVAMGLAGPSHGASVIDVVSTILKDMDPDPDPPMNQINPVIYEDDDYTIFADNAGNPAGTPPAVNGDRILGIFDVPKLHRGTPTGISTLPFSAIGPAYVLDTAAYGNLELTGAFELELVNTIVVDPTTTIFQFGPVAPASRVLLSSNNPNTVYEFFEDTVPPRFVANGVSLAADKVEAQDGTAYAEIGFGGSGTLFYEVIADATNSGFESVRFSLNFTAGPPLLTSPWTGFEPIVVNSLGTEIYGFGGLSPISGTCYDRKSDVDAVVLYAPVPAAVWPGMMMLGGLAVIRKLRIRSK